METKLTRGSMKYPSGDEVYEAFQKEVYNHPEYHRHIKETAKILKVSPQIVEDVITHYFSSIMILISRPRIKNILRVIVYAWLKIDVCIDPNVYKLNKKKYDTDT